MNKHLLACCLWLAGACLAQVPSGPVSDDTEARTRIARDRAEANARFAAQEKQCYQRFAVNDCLDNARRLRRQSLGVLSREEMGLNEARRRQTSAARQRELEEKSHAETERQVQSREGRAQPPDGKRNHSAGWQQLTPPADGASAPSPQPAPPHRAKPKKPGPTTAEVTEAERRFQEKQREAAKHRDDLARKLAQRKKPPAAPLPVP